MGSAWFETVFLQILSMSLTGVYCILAVLLVRLLLKRQPKIFSYVLWIIVLFRLVCPISFESPFSAFHETNTSVMTSQGLQKVRRIDGMGVWMGELSEENNQESSEYVSLLDERTTADIRKNSSAEKDLKASDKNISLSPEMVKSRLSDFFQNESYMKNFWFTAGAVWFAGVCGMLIYAVFSAASLRKRLQNARQQEYYYVMEGLETPFVFGMIHPRIYLPLGLSEGEIPYILEHERTHIRRRDYIIKPVAFLVLCIHWFNPLVWLAFSCMGKDMEMSCDEAVLKKMGKDIRQEYSVSLLALACDRRFLNGSPLAFGEGEVKGRIKNILNYKKPGFWGILLAIVVIIGAGVVLISNPKTSEMEKENKESSMTGDTHNKTNSEEERPSENDADITKEQETDTAITKSLPVYQMEEEEQVKELLASFGTMTYKELMAGEIDTENMVVFTNVDDPENLERWTAFCEQAQAGNEDAVVILQYTIEGDPILIYVSYRDGNYYRMYDSSRDKFGGSDYYESGQAPFLKEYFSNGYAEYYLTNEENLSLDQIESYYLSSDVPVSERGIYRIFSFPYAYLEESLGTEAVKEMAGHDLEACITNAILSENAASYPTGVFQTEAHHNLKIEKKDGETIVYTHVLYQTYISLEEEAAGSYIPTAITFTQDEAGAYEQKEYWIPKEGSYYKTSIEEKFPEDIWEYALDGQRYIVELEERCHGRAEDYFSNGITNALYRYWR